MAHDIQAIKDRLDLREIFKRDGHVAKRMGANWFVPCPFHEEKSGSCKVEEKKFHCFGCGAGTDVFDYWERSRGISKKDAMDQLASLAGIAPLADYQPATVRPARRPKVEEVILPLTTEEREAWFACVERLRSQPAEIRRIADWRGIGEDVIEWVILHGVIGLKRWNGVWREAFLVEMPESPTGPLVPVSTHVRLGPHTPGNERPKASWRFEPKERGAWPMVFGDTATAKHIFIVEGQWDALAIIHLMHWHKAWPPTLAVVAMRGATSFRKFISHYALNDRATAFAIADADNAGAEWFVENGLAHQLSEKVRYVHAFWPGQRGADLNDLVKQGSITREFMVAMLSPKLHNRRLRKPSGPTFLGWCRTRATAPEPLGWAARHVANDEARPKGRRPLKNWTRHWTKLALTTDKQDALTAAFHTYKSESTLA
jgi:hypothetical protein